MVEQAQARAKIRRHCRASQYLRWGLFFYITLPSFLKPQSVILQTLIYFGRSRFVKSSHGEVLGRPESVHVLFTSTSYKILSIQTISTTSKMSDSQPIDPARFASALVDLPADALFAKIEELKNSITHLHSSNQEMLPFAEAGDQDCKDAMFENLGVIARVNERIELIKKEIQNRGLMNGTEEGVHL
ncbi:hypothetical protein MRB53_040586 [Persea americana]|nr:hypothetical protein MRB53_040586 [Persea americana]